MPDPRSAFHSATPSTESNADLISIYATSSCLLKFWCNSANNLNNHHDKVYMAGQTGPCRFLGFTVIGHSRLAFVYGARNLHRGHWAVSRQNIVSSFASSFSDEDNLQFFSDIRVTLLRYWTSYLCLQWRRLGFGSGLQLMLLFVKIKYAVHKTYGGLGNTPCSKITKPREVW